MYLTINVFQNVFQIVFKMTIYYFLCVIWIMICSNTIAMHRFISFVIYLCGYILVNKVPSCKLQKQLLVTFLNNVPLVNFSLWHAGKCNYGC